MRYGRFATQQQQAVTWRRCRCCSEPVLTSTRWQVVTARWRFLGQHVLATRYSAVLLGTGADVD